MLTFFEYLRQRAFESVLTGAHEALDFLERQQALAEPKKQIPSTAEDGVAKNSKPPRKREEQFVPAPSKQGSRTTSNDPLLKHGKAGRPSADEKGTK